MPQLPESGGYAAEGSVMQQHAAMTARRDCGKRRIRIWQAATSTPTESEPDLMKLGVSEEMGVQRVGNFA